MAPIALGFEPLDLSVALSADAAFYTTLANSAAWDDGIAIELRFPVPGVDPTDWITWSASITGPVATFLEVPSAVNPVVAQAKLIGGAGRARVRLHYIDADGRDLLWGEGPIDVT